MLGEIESKETFRFEPWQWIFCDGKTQNVRLSNTLCIVAFGGATHRKVNERMGKYQKKKKNRFRLVFTFVIREKQNLSVPFETFSLLIISFESKFSNINLLEVLGEIMITMILGENMITMVEQLTKHVSWSEDWKYIRLSYCRKKKLLRDWLF